VGRRSRRIAKLGWESYLGSGERGGRERERERETERERGRGEGREGGYRDPVGVR